MTTQADEIDHVEVIETHEAPVEDVPLSVAPVDKLATKRSLVKTSISEVTPPTKAVVTQHVTTVELVSTEPPQGEASKFNIITLASAGK